MIPKHIGATFHVGIDLGCSALSQKPSSAVAVLDADGRFTELPRHFRKAAELITVLEKLPREQTIIAVDAPRSVPDCGTENYARRSCETELQAATKEHVGSFAGVAALFVRWYEIEIRHLQGWHVVETYPRAIWAALKIPGKPKEYGKRSVEVCDSIRSITTLDCTGFTNHQVDASLCAFTALCYARQQVKMFGADGEGLMVLPDLLKSVGSGTIVAEWISDGFRRFPSQITTAQ